jgi:hypothetical protein
MTSVRLGRDEGPRLADVFSRPVILLTGRPLKTAAKGGARVQGWLLVTQESRLSVWGDGFKHRHLILFEIHITCTKTSGNKMTTCARLGKNWVCV